ncbi:UNVERIFIED_CONTAM: hypothetical protein Slati_2374600 [Sesamum latifolium]|uniref:DDE Tnp4 domain-containing protein n=1 Tax=Sesamum latifolium TaxID=2727402 RepID=A0AAW2WDX1_9LAMI
MDGTLVLAWIPRVDQNRYRSRKGRLAQNILAICDFDMNFTYVYAGWEGSAADARVLDHAVSQDPIFPFPPISKYYLVDAGFTNYQCFLAPYRGTRYHLPEWRGQGRRYRTLQDMFNHAHSQLRNVIERAFGVLNKRFPILQWGMPSYLLNHQVDIVIACCTLHNFIRRDDETAEAQMSHWARRLRKYFGYPYTRDQVRHIFFEFKWQFRVFHALTEIPEIQYNIETFHATRFYSLARRYFQYPEPLYPSMLEVWGPIRLQGAPAQGHDDAHDGQSSNATHSPARGGPDAPISISDSTVPLEKSHTHIASWDAVENVARGDGRPRLARSRTVAERPSLDMGSKWGNWIVEIYIFGVQSY